VSLVDPRSVEIRKTIDVEGSPREVGVGTEGVWVTTDER
jgi:hypothetical protein